MYNIERLNNLLQKIYLELLRQDNNTNEYLNNINYVRIMTYFLYICLDAVFVYVVLLIGVKRRTQTLNDIRDREM